MGTIRRSRLWDDDVGSPAAVRGGHRCVRSDFWDGDHDELCVPIIRTVPISLYTINTRLP